MDNLKLNDTIVFTEKARIDPEELAVKFGVTNQSVSKWESAQCCPDISLIPKLADIFDISILRQLDIRFIANSILKRLR